MGSVETNSTVTVVGKIKDQVTTMLVDTGSAVTVVRADLWESITGGHPIELKPPEQPVVVADGKPLEQLGQASVLIQVGGVCTQQNVLVVQKLTQECLLGADFLKHHGCVIDLQRRHLLAGGEAVPLQSLNQTPETLSVCHVRIMETAVIPEQHEVQVQVQLSKMEGGSIEDFMGIMAPELKFSRRHSLLVA